MSAFCISQALFILVMIIENIICTECVDASVVKNWSKNTRLKDSLRCLRCFKCPYELQEWNLWSTLTCSSWWDLNERSEKRQIVTPYFENRVTRKKSSRPCIWVVCQANFWVCNCYLYAVFAVLFYRFAFACILPFSC